eukprot:scaffold2483_cov287-Prasinococcus_capsulatus_cf.AAC.7
MLGRGRSRSAIGGGQEERRGGGGGGGGADRARDDRARGAGNRGRSVALMRARACPRRGSPLHALAAAPRRDAGGRFTGVGGRGSPIHPSIRPLAFWPPSRTRRRGGLSE